MIVLVMPGTKTQWGKVVMVGKWFTGERYYWMVDQRGTVSMIPACVVEAHRKGG